MLFMKVRHHTTVGEVAVQGSTRNLTWEISALDEGGRMETFVRRRLPHLSRRQSAKAIEENAFVVNGRLATKGQRLKQGDRVIFQGAQHWLLDSPVRIEIGGVKIAYEDAEIILLDKPAGIPTHGFSARDVDTLANFILARWPELFSVGRSRWEPGLLNRLDTETSGLVMVAKNQPAFNHLREQFRRRRVTKKYIALVRGAAATSGSISLAIAHEPSDNSRMQVVNEFASDRLRPRSWHALTCFRKLASSDEMSLLEISMKTGVTHQIRVHLAAIGHAIVGDSLYGSKNYRTILERHFLHASRLDFAHPANDQPMVVESPLPTELSSFLKRIEIVG
jgi:23S rRNA pseudouridine1911/1915/1917 synthase